VDGDDVGVVEGGGRACFLLETLEAFHVAAGSAAKDLDRHGPTEREITGAIDLAHAPRSQLFQDLVAAEGLLADQVGAFRRVHGTRLICRRAVG
jgi:hypothetical protein